MFCFDWFFFFLFELSILTTLPYCCWSSPSFFFLFLVPDFSVFGYYLMTMMIGLMILALEEFPGAVSAFFVSVC